MKRTVVWMAVAIVCSLVFYSIGFNVANDKANIQINSLNARNKSLKGQITNLDSEINSLKAVNSPITPPYGYDFTPTTPVTSCAVTTCADGSCSNSTGRGTCSYHGGEL